ncbi:UNVERIFIED_CONTAM: hypothetical protein Sangu_1540800 [Sesamum angustifolium]|uniref:SWIM-type domain-containing protein n=1 Tax=Sesamum angustifolium TaxID=2727405 RepID=A0AAW2MTM4_9LAMI
MTGYVSIDIFVQAEKIREMVVPDDPAVSEWGPSSYASPSDYAGPSSFAGPSDYAGTSSHAGPSVSNEADSLLNNEHVDSEPDEVEVEGLTTNNPENNDEVSIEVMIDVLGNTASEVPADSIDIPTGAWGNFYDSNTGELTIGMVFKSKDHLKASVQDFSVRFARREYRVVESKPKLWKVACKYDQQTGCSWMLRGYSSEHGLIQNYQTVYRGIPLLSKCYKCRRNPFVHKYKHKLLVAVTLDANQQIVSGLISAINYVPAFKFPRGVHRFFLRHVCSNFNKKFNNIRLKDLCWRAGAEVNARKFERIMTEIRELNEEAYNWLGMIDKTQWTLSHDSGWRTVRYFWKRTTRCHRMLNANQEWADFAFRIFEARQAEAGSHTYVVKLKHKTCSCGKWGTHGIPCSHAIQVSRHFGVNASNFIPQYYSIRAYRKTYQGRFEPLYGEEYWDPVDFELVHNPAVRVHREPGRYVSTRIPNEMDRPQARARQQYQSRQV